MQCPNCHTANRDTAKFCSACGYRLTPPLASPPPAANAPPIPGGTPRAGHIPPPAAGQPPPAARPTEIVRPKPVVGLPPAPVPKSPVPRPAVAPAVHSFPPAAPPAARRTSRWQLPLAGIAVLVMLALAALWFFVLREGGSAAVPDGDRVLFTIAEGGIGSVAGQSLIVITREGSDVQELVFDRDGIWPGYDYANSHRGVAPDGRWLATTRFQDDGPELVLVPTDSGAELFSDPDIGFDGRFAPDSSAYAYTRLVATDAGDEFSLVVVNTTGQLVGEWADLLLVDFLAGGNSLLALRGDDEGLFTGLVTVDLPDGQPARVVDLADSTGPVAPFVYDDMVYYFSDEELVRVQTNGEGQETIYRTESDVPLVLVAPGLERLLILERPAVDDHGDLYSLLPDGSDRARLGEAVYRDPGQGGSGGPMVATAGDRVAFTSRDGDGLSLYVSNADGGERRRLIDEQAWLVFAFSPDGDELAYIAGASAGQPGDLLVAQLPDGDATRVAGNAWSFLYAGDHILYSAVENAGDNPQSAIHSVTATGEDDEITYGPVEGLIRFHSPAR